MNIGAFSFSEFKTAAREFHGYPAPGLLVGGYMVEAVKKALPRGILYDALVETRKCLPDAVQLLTPCSTGNGWMKILPLGRYAVALYDKQTGEGFRASVDTEKLASWPELRAWFLKAKPKAEQDDAALFNQIEQAGDAYVKVAPVQVVPTFLRKGRSREVSLCPVCGEAYPASDGPICRGCQGDAPYVVQRPQELRAEPEIEAVPVEQAVGKRVLHDMTRIIPGRSKGPVYTSGQRIEPADLYPLQQMGRSFLYISESAVPDTWWIHENEAVLAFAEQMAGENVSFSPVPKEGKISFFALCDGLLCFDAERLERFNLCPDVMCAARQNQIPVAKEKPFAGCRAIPLYIARDLMSRALTALGEAPLFRVLPFQPLKVGVLITGSEVANGLIEDKFFPVIQSKLQHFGCPVVGSELVADSRSEICAAAKKLCLKGAELIITTAGLSVDPDDVTRKGLLDAGLEDVIYGAPVLPGAMTLTGRIGDVRVLGVPACALYFKTTSLDLFLPRLLAGREITRADVAKMAEGGFCLGCRTCTFPKCPFGK
jgi:formylmethanofuran dehydrogenase subunit E